jgi:hypothetical protein
MLYIFLKELLNTFPMVYRTSKLVPTVPQEKNSLVSSRSHSWAAADLAEDTKCSVVKHPSAYLLLPFLGSAKSFPTFQHIGITLTADVMKICYNFRNEISKKAYNAVEDVGDDAMDLDEVPPNMGHF